MGEADQTLDQRRSQLEMARQQSANPDNVKLLGEQLAQAGQLPADATEEEKPRLRRSSSTSSSLR